MSTSSSQTLIDSFTFNDSFYAHYMVLDTDSVYLIGEDPMDNDLPYPRTYPRVPLIEYTVDCYAYTIAKGKHDQLLGRFSLQDNRWVYTPTGNVQGIVGSAFNDPEGLLKDEITVSKAWLVARLAQSQAQQVIKTVV